MSELAALRSLSPDGRLILLSRSVRLFAFGALSVILVLHFASLGWSETVIGRLLALTMTGDAAVTLWVTLHADRIGRARMLRIGAWLMVLVGIVLPATTNVWLIAPVAFLGSISLNGGEVGPFMALEQAALSDSANRTTAIAWYILCGSLATALGALASGFLDSYRAVFALYAACGVVLWSIFRALSPAIEPPPGKTLAPRFGLHKSRPIVLRLSALFMLDTFGSGLVVQSFLAYWLHRRFSIGTAAIGSIFFGMNLLAAFSSLVAGRLAARFGLINTMVWTHIPASLLLISLPWMPSLTLAILILLLRGCLSQMDVPARQSYLMAVVEPDERSAAGGVTGLAKSLAGAISPPITGALFAAGWMSVPFLAAGTLKIAYDLALWRSFRSIKPPEER
jgi:MFS family permease